MTKMAVLVEFLHDGGENHDEPRDSGFPMVWSLWNSMDLAAFVF